MSARRLVRVAAMLAAAGALAVVAGAAQGALDPLNDLFAVGQGTGDSPAAAPVVHRAEPPSGATPLAPCGPGSRPATGCRRARARGLGVERPVVQRRR